jgi:hypothetical protein
MARDNEQWRIIVDSVMDFQVRKRPIHSRVAEGQLSYGGTFH